MEDQQIAPSLVDREDYDTKIKAHFFGFWHPRMNVLLKNQDHTFTGIDEIIIAPVTTPYILAPCHARLSELGLSSCIIMLNLSKSVSNFSSLETAAYDKISAASGVESTRQICLCKPYLEYISHGRSTHAIFPSEI